MVPTTDDTENQRVQTYNDAFPAWSRPAPTAGKHVIMVDMYGAYTKTPTTRPSPGQQAPPMDAGYAVMANTWWDASAIYCPPNSKAPYTCPCPCPYTIGG